MYVKPLSRVMPNADFPCKHRDTVEKSSGGIESFVLLDASIRRHDKFIGKK